MSRLKTFLGYFIAIAGLLWVFYDIASLPVGDIFTHFSLPWLALSILLDVASYCAQGWRWQLILDPIGRLSPYQATRAVYAGLFTNELFPLRAGEAVRAFAVSRQTGIKAGKVISSIVIERIIDGIWLIAAVTAAIAMVGLPENIVHGDKVLGLGLGIIIIVGLLGLALLSSFKKLTPGEHNIFTKILHRLAHSEHKEGIDVLLKPKPKLIYGFLVSFLILLFQGLSYWAMAKAYGLEISLLVGCAVFLIVHVGTMLPNAPANIGSYQFFTVLGLTFFGFDKTLAAGFSIAGFAALTLPLLVLGFFAASGSGMTFSKLRGKAAEQQPPETRRHKIIRRLLIALAVLLAAFAVWHWLVPRFYTRAPKGAQEYIKTHPAAQHSADWERIKNLPIVEVPTTGPSAASDKHTLIILISGDGGWGGTETNMSADFTHYGLPVIGINSARYFLSERTPQQMADDAAAILKFYGSAWNKDRFVLVGYSLGANALPFLYNRLPYDLQSRVDVLAFMGLEPTAQFKITPSYFFSKNGADTIAEINKISGPQLYCLYGDRERDSACPLLRDHSTILMRSGDHRVLKNYNLLLNPIVDTAK